MSERGSDGRAVIVCAPFGRDAETVAALLREQKYDVVTCQDLRHVAQLIEDHVGAVILTEEALNGDLAQLKESIDRQPSWSDLPFILLSTPRVGITPNAQLASLKLFDTVRNSVVLERPIGKASLTSAVASAMRL